MSKATRLSGLVMDVRQGEVITIGHNIKVTILEKSGRITRIRVGAPLDVKVSKESNHGKDSQHATQRPPD